MPRLTPRRGLERTACRGKSRDVSFQLTCWYLDVVNSREGRELFCLKSREWRETDCEWYVSR